MPAAKLRPVVPRTTAVPPVMYSQDRGRRRPRPPRRRRSCARRTAPPLGPGGELPAGRAVEHGVAGDDLVLGGRARRPAGGRRALGIGCDDQPPAGQALADVVVGVTGQAQRHPARYERAERLAGGAAQRDGDGAGPARRRRGAGSPRRRASRRRCGRCCGPRRPGAPVCRRSAGAAAAISRVRRSPAPVGGPGPAGASQRRVLRQVGRGQHRRQVQAARLPVPDRGTESSRSTRPIASSSVRSPSVARISRTSSARKRKKFATNSGWPVKRLRSSGFCVAMPTGHVSRWHTRIITQPETISGAVAKPYSSAPSSAATTTSRPVLSWPSTCTVTRSRSRWPAASAALRRDPAPHGAPACLSPSSAATPPCRRRARRSG